MPPHPRLPAGLSHSLVVSWHRPLPPHTSYNRPVCQGSQTRFQAVTSGGCDPAKRLGKSGLQARQLAPCGHGPGHLYNPRKSKGRQASDITHESAHFILDHRPATLILSPDSDVAMRSFDPKQEDEANWLSWCLLLPREALLHAKRRGLSTAQIAGHYGVTETLVSFRMQKTGVLAQLKAASRRPGAARM